MFDKKDADGRIALALLPRNITEQWSRRFINYWFFLHCYTFRFFFFLINTSSQLTDFTEYTEKVKMALKFRPALFICDVQERFRSAIYAYPEVISGSAKTLKFFKAMDLPVFVTTQNRAKLGNTVKELDVTGAVADVDKTKFSMVVPELMSKLDRDTKEVAIVGIESHICVLQTTIDLIKGMCATFYATSSII